MFLALLEQTGLQKRRYCHFWQFPEFHDPVSIPFHRKVFKMLFFGPILHGFVIKTDADPVQGQIRNDLCTCVMFWKSHYFSVLAT